MNTDQARANIEQFKTSYPYHLFEEWEVEINIIRDGTGNESAREYIKKRLIRNNLKLSTEDVIILNSGPTGQPHGMLSFRYYPQEANT